MKIPRAKLVELMMKELRQWPRGGVAEPSDARKLQFANAFADMGEPRRQHESKTDRKAKQIR